MSNLCAKYVGYLFIQATVDFGLCR